MASTNKTDNLELNNWVGGDRSQREDFNSDNEKIDTWAGEVNSQLNDIAQDINTLKTGKQDLIVDSGNITLPLTVTNSISGYTPKYRKVGSECKLSGKTNGVSANSTQIATLPTGYRPTETSTFVTVFFNGTKFITCTIIVQANGTVSFISSSDGTVPTSACEIYLNGIAFYCN